MIQVDNVCKTFKVLNRKDGLKGAFLDLFSQDYKYVEAVKGISFHVDKGEIVGLIGTNGAGKSTTIKMMTGILKPTSGTIQVNGIVPQKERKKHLKNIGIVFGQRSQLWWQLPVLDSFRIIKEIYGVEDKVYQGNLKMMEDLLNIQSFYKKPVRQLSLGQRMLCEIVAAFLYDPAVVFLDEPTIGLDVSIKSKIRNVIHVLNETKNTTIILTSHDTSDIEALCKRIIVIDKGMIAFNDGIEKMKQFYGKYRNLKILVDDTYKHTLKHSLLQLSTEEGAIQIDDDTEGWVCCEFDQEKVQIANILNSIFKEYPILDIKIEDIGIENVVKKIYEVKKG